MVSPTTGGSGVGRPFRARPTRGHKHTGGSRTAGCQGRRGPQLVHRLFHRRLARSATRRAGKVGYPLGLRFIRRGREADRPFARTGQTNLERKMTRELVRRDPVGHFFFPRGVLGVTRARASFFRARMPPGSCRGAARVQPLEDGAVTLGPGSPVNVSIVLGVSGTNDRAERSSRACISASIRRWIWAALADTFRSLASTAPASSRL